jgi:hypothetical protein
MSSNLKQAVDCRLSIIFDFSGSQPSLLLAQYCMTTDYSIETTVHTLFTVPDSTLRTVFGGHTFACLHALGQDRCSLVPDNNLLMGRWFGCGHYCTIRQTRHIRN